MTRFRLFNAALIVLLLTLAPAPISAQQTPVRIIFMHHSTGAGLIEGGGVRQSFTDRGYEFWDHGYNGDGLVDAEGNWLGINWDVPGDNTDPDGWHTIFLQPVTSPPDNTFSHMLEYDVIIFKSCFPNADITSEEQLEMYKSYYLDIRDVIDQHPDKLFIAFTNPPLTPNSTSPEAASRARRWAEYLTSPEYLDGHPNLVVFDFYSLLADEDGYLRAEYRPDDVYDSHPNELANRTIGPLFVDFVDQAVHDFVPGEDVIVPNAGAVGANENVPQTTAGPLLLDFEQGIVSDDWWVYVNEEADRLACDAGEPGYNSDKALQMLLQIPAGGSAGCGTSVESTPAWVQAGGISFVVRSEPPDLALNVLLGVADPTQANPDDGATPFEMSLRTESGEWTQVALTWDQFIKPDWVGDTGVNEFSPSQVVWITFDVGYWDAEQEGTIWIDDIQLIPAG